MSAYKDEIRKTWYIKFYYTDWKGNKKQKLKRGFKTLKEAKEYERNFLNSENDINDMFFSTIVELYLKDISKRLKETSTHTKTTIINNHILPYFGSMVISDIKPTTVRHWQAELLAKNFKENFLKTCQANLSAIFNYAVKYYSLKENPCVKAGAISNKENRTTKNDMRIYTLDEYKRLISFEDNPQYKLIFNILYFSGCRIGELLALTINDIDLDNNTISINKTLTRLNKIDIVTTPKTSKSTRVITIPKELTNEIKEYIEMLYDTTPNIRLITYIKRSISVELTKLSNKAELHHIRVHDLRHSHASLLIELGFSPLLISERLGHEKVETTLNTYSHLYPNKQEEIANTLQDLLVSN